MPALVGALLLSPVLSAQTPQPPPSAPPPSAPAPSFAQVTVDARTTRGQLQELMTRLPPNVGRILKMDPTLLRSDSYLGQYPALASFVAAHPEIANNPHYYFEFVRTGDDWEPLDPRSETVRMYRNMMEAVSVFVIFITVAGLLAWFVRTFIDYRRWLRLSKVQTEVHGKLLDRFAGTGELLAYVQSPAGRRFLESAPIPLDTAPRQMAAPFARILWAVQAGVVIAVVGVGFQIVSRRVIEDIGQPLAVFGVMCLSLGIGFILSAAASYLLSRHLGLLDSTPPVERQDSSLA